MRFLILGRDIPLTDFNKHKSEAHSEIACKEPLNNEYDENCKKHISNSSSSDFEFEKENLLETEDTDIGVKPKLRGPVV